MNDPSPPPPAGGGPNSDLINRIISSSTPPPRRAGIPPAHPHHAPYLQIPPSPSPSPSYSPHHSRSLSQPAFFNFDSLPTFTPSSDPAAPPSPSTSPWVNTSDGLPPLKSHRRSHSEIPYGFIPRPKQELEWGPAADGGDDFLSSCINMDSFDNPANSSDYEGESSSFNESGNSEPQVKDGNKRSAGDFTTPVRPRHSRSVSVDSVMDKINFDGAGAQQRGQHSRSGSMDGTQDIGGVEFGNGEFNAAEIKKIMANDKLADMAMADPKRVKRILANRQSAARSKERKTRYISELEHKVQTLQSEATTLSTQLAMLQRDSTGLTHQNNELKVRLHAMESQAQLRDALNEALKGEVQRLKHATAELGETQLSNSLSQQMQLNPQMFQGQQLQKHYQQQQIQQQSAQMYQLQQQQQQQQNNRVSQNESNN